MGAGVGDDFDDLVRQILEEFRCVQTRIVCPVCGVKGMTLSATSDVVVTSCRSCGSCRGVPVGPDVAVEEE